MKTLILLLVLGFGFAPSLKADAVSDCVEQVIEYTKFQNGDDFDTSNHEVSAQEDCQSETFRANMKEVVKELDL